MELLAMTTTGFRRFYEWHGEGVQHIDFWCPTCTGRCGRCSTPVARFVSTLVGAQGNAVVYFKPGDLDAVPLPRSL